MTRRFTNNVTLQCGSLTFAGAVAATLALQAVTGDWVVAWLVAITAITFFTYGYDKSVAGSQRMRVPEAVLLALAACGGTPGAIAGMRFFRHKTSKDSFLAKFTGVVAVQVAAILACVALCRR